MVKSFEGGLPAPARREPICRVRPLRSGRESVGRSPTEVCRRTVDRSNTARRRALGRSDRRDRSRRRVPSSAVRRTAPRARLHRENSLGRVLRTRVHAVSHVAELAPGPDRTALGLEGRSNSENGRLRRPIERGSRPTSGENPCRSLARSTADGPFAPRPDVRDDPSPLESLARTGRRPFEAARRQTLTVLGFLGETIR